MRVAVIGAGIAGLAAGLRLAKQGHECDVYERWPGLGGQVATLDVGAGDALERYYHHLFTSDRSILDLYDELGMGSDVEWFESSVAMFAEGATYPFTSPLDLLRYKPLSLRSRLRMGVAALALQRLSKRVEPFETRSARDWIESGMGPEVWDKVWGPIFRGKFGDRADEISAAWLWSKLTVRRQIRGREARRESLGYPRGGWQPLLGRLSREITDRRGRVLIDRPAASISRAGGAGLLVHSGAPGSFRRGTDPRDFATVGEPERYDGVIATVPGEIFLALLDPELAAAIGAQYRRRVEGAEYNGALCLLLELDRPFSGFYWTNIAEDEIPFIGLIEHTNMVPRERYGGRRYLYVANYVDDDDPLLALDRESLIARYEAGLRRVNPDWSPHWIQRSWLFREAAAQPIVTVGHQDRIPPLRTPVERLVLANTQQIYPEDRGTNYSVALAERAVAALLEPELQHR